jgi:hypothetical protein
MVIEYPNPLGGPSASHICAMPSSLFVPHVRLNHLPQDDLETWFGDQSMPVTQDLKLTLKLCTLISQHLS